MKAILIFAVLIFHTVISLAQEKTLPTLLKTDTTWGKEIFEFPIRFAKEINYQGYEEAQFPKGWSNRDTLTFWSYAFAWYIDVDTMLSVRTLEKDLELYFDGLNEIKMKRENGVYIPNTVALILKKDESTFIGKLRIFDRFTKKKLFLLNAIIEQKYCKEKKKMIILFKFSPKDFGHEVWDILEEVKVRSEICGGD